MNDDIEYVIYVIIASAISFALGLSIGSFTDECIKSDYLAKTLYKDTTEYTQHRHDNFYNLLKLVEIKEQECIKRK